MAEFFGNALTGDNTGKEIGGMAEIGAFLSSEEHGPSALLRQAQLAEEAGFRSLFISDHFHPWIERQRRAHSYGA